MAIRDIYGCISPGLDARGLVLIDTLSYGCISAANDKLPKRLTDVPQDPDNPKTKVPLEVMKKTYYAARGWDQNGIPTEATLRRLKIK